MAIALQMDKIIKIKNNKNIVAVELLRARAFYEKKVTAFHDATNIIASAPRENSA